jgi:hypothetical protein
VSPWVKGLLGGAIAGSANGVLTGLAACGIAPEQFNFHGHAHGVFALAGLSALFGVIIGTAAYLSKSPLP